MLQVNVTLVDLRREKQAAEGDFIRIQGVLKYLKHLENKAEPDPCPICKEVPTMKVSVNLR